MTNPFITAYENNKMTNSHITAAKKALEELKKNRETWEYEKKQQSNIKFGLKLRGFKLFYNADVTAKNIAAIDSILNGMKDTEDETQQIREEFVNLLKNNQSQLSQGETRELVEHIIKDIGGIDYDNRPFNTIDAPLSIFQLLKRKQLPTDIFVKKEIQFTDDISEHAKWVYEHIYRHPYPNQTGKREIHGIPHVTRTAIYAPVLANLYRKYNDPEANKLTEEDLKLIQIALLFHDSARENEGADKWDHESAFFLYYYLTQVLNVDVKKAKLLAEAVANKDPNPQGYLSLMVTDKEICWKRTAPKDRKNIYEKIIHDADCLDIIRARECFEGVHLDFYKQYGTRNNFALNEMGHLITEARSLIEIQGDTYKRIKPEVKAKYDHADAYVACKKSFQPHHKILSRLCGELLPKKKLESIELIDMNTYDPSAGLTEGNMQAALERGILARAIVAPSAHAKKPRKSRKEKLAIRSGDKIFPKPPQYETLAALELRKTLRRKDTPTSSSKVDYLNKEGNQLRSTSLFSYGSGSFGNTGFLIFDIDIDAISTISAIDIGTGRGKKRQYPVKPLSRKEKLKKLEDLHTHLKLGGSTGRFRDELNRFASNHVEILYNTSDYDAIYFSQDPSIYNMDIYGSPDAAHPYSPILQAIFLRNEYQNARKKTLPLFEYSGIHNTLRLVPEHELSEENIIKMWVSMCSDYIKKELANLHSHAIFTRSEEEIKTLSMYKTLDNRYALDNAPADSNYNTDLKTKVSQAIKSEKERLFKEHFDHIEKQVKSSPASILNDDTFFELLRNPVLLQTLKKNVEEQLTEAMKSSSIDSNEIISIFNMTNLIPEKLQALEPGYQDERFYYSKTIKMFILAKEIGMHEVIEHIQQQMSSFVLNRIKTLNKMDRHLVHVINIIQSFDIQSYPPIENKLNELAKDFFKNAVQLMETKQLSFYDYYKYRCSFMKAGINVAEQQEADKYSFDLMQSSILDNDALIAYLDIAKNLDISSDVRNKIIDAWLHKNKIVVEPDGLSMTYNLIKYIKQEMVDDYNLFQMIVNHIGVNTIRFLQFFPDEVKVDIWLGTVQYIQAQMPNKQFDEKQLNILQARLNYIVDKWLKGNILSGDCEQLLSKIINDDIGLEPPKSLLKQTSAILNIK